MKVAPSIIVSLCLNGFGLSNLQTLWPNATVPYSISDRLNEAQHGSVTKAIEIIQNLSCVRFVQIAGQSDDRSPPHVRIQLAKRDGGCWSSNTGFAGGAQSLSLEAGVCFHEPTILHELMHVLGFLHEHSRPDRDDHVLVIWERVPPEKKRAFAKRSYHDAYILDWLTSYDHRSIMHYSEYAFGSEAASESYIQPTMISKKGHRLGGAKMLSAMDVSRLNKMYMCS